MKVRFRKHISIGRVVAKLVTVVLALYVGGTIMIEIGSVLNGTESPFYKGLTLIGWTVGDYPYNGSLYAATCSGTTYTETVSNGANCITSVSGSGILAVIGIIGIATIVMKFVQVSF